MLPSSMSLLFGFYFLDKMTEERSSARSLLIYEPNISNEITGTCLNGLPSLSVDRKYGDAFSSSF